MQWCTQLLALDVLGNFCYVIFKLSRFRAGFYFGSAKTRVRMVYWNSSLSLKLKLNKSQPDFLVFWKSHLAVSVAPFLTLVQFHDGIFGAKSTASVGKSRVRNTPQQVFEILIFPKLVLLLSLGNMVRTAVWNCVTEILKYRNTRFAHLLRSGGRLTVTGRSTIYTKFYSSWMKHGIKWWLFCNLPTMYLFSYRKFGYWLS